MIRKTFKTEERFYHATMRISGIINKDFNGILQTLYNNSANNVDADWGNSLYTSQNEEVTCGYILQDGAIGCIIELEATEDIPCFSSDDMIYASTTCGQSTPESTKREISAILGEEINEPFMTFLGNEGYAFECPHDNEGGIEVIIPSCMIKKFKVVSVRYLKYNTHEFCYETPTEKEIASAAIL